MSVGITDFAHFIRKSTAQTSEPISLSHAQQLVCAALGHKTLASFQTSQADGQEPQSFDSVEHVVIDSDLLLTRARELGIQFSKQRLEWLITSALKSRNPNIQHHLTFSELIDEFQEGMQDAALQDDYVNSAMANANYDGVEEVYITADQEPNLEPFDEPLTVEVSGHVTLGIDLERPYCGHQVQFSMEATIQRSGRRCFEEAGAEFTVVAAGLDDGLSDDHEPDSKPTLAEELSTRLNIELSEAEELIDAEPMELSGSSGEMTYSLLFDFTEHASPALAAKLLQQRGSLQLEVETSFFALVQRSH